MRMTINMATRTYVDSTRLNLSFVVLASILVLGIVVTARAIATIQGEIGRVSRETSVLEGKNRGNVGEKEYQDLLSRIGDANAIIAAKTYDWLALLDRLEVVVPEGVAITGIQPDIKNQGLVLNGVTVNFAGLRRFVENLEDSRDFTDVYLVSHNETRIGAKQSGLMFNINCKVASK